MPGPVLKPPSILQVMAEVFIHVLDSSNWEF